ncbi:GD16027 [Drosophila simulans]|uniref:GD16027 n=2 Tax=Drosophila simulans TaxID=7240 RepID=B4R7K9_DROSI|nr:GD16027 [Drosophila simulans]
MVNAVMDAIALLSSLASDLDIMLNDLRSAPSHAATATATATTTATVATATATATTMANRQQQQQQQMQSRQLQAHQWQSINNNKNNNISNNNNNNINNNNNNINNNNNNNNHLAHPPCLIDIKLKSSRSAATTITHTTTSNQLQQQQRRRVAPKPLPRPPRRTRPTGQKEVGPSEEDGDTDASDLANMTSPLSASAAATRINGLSPEVKKVQRLPLWNARNGNGSTNTHCHPTGVSVQRRLPIQSHQQRILNQRFIHQRLHHG